MRRGEIWTVAGGSDYSGKPRPAVILQDDRFDTDSVTVCPFTTDPTEAPLFRVEIEPGDANRLSRPCRPKVDKITTVRRSRRGERVGQLSEADIVRLDRAVVVFLGMASSG